MKLTRRQIKELIVEAWRGRIFTLPLPQGPVDLPVPEGFSKRKDRPDKLNPGLHEIELMSHDKQRMMDISVNLKTGGIAIHIFVRNPDNKVFTFVAMSTIWPGSSEAEIFEDYAEMIEVLKNENPEWM